MFPLRSLTHYLPSFSTLVQHLEEAQNIALICSALNTANFVFSSSNGAEIQNFLIDSDLILCIGYAFSSKILHERILNFRHNPTSEQEKKIIVLAALIFGTLTAYEGALICSRSALQALYNFQFLERVSFEQTALLKNLQPTFFSKFLNGASISASGLSALAYALDLFQNPVAPNPIAPNPVARNPVTSRLKHFLRRREV